MNDTDYFQTSTYKMLCSIPVEYRRPLNNSKTYRAACVKINGYNTVVVYKKRCPIGICSSIVDAMNPICGFHDKRALKKALRHLADYERFLDVPSFVYPAR